MQSVVILGSGNVGYHLSKIFMHKNMLKQVWSRSLSSASEIAEPNNIPFTAQIGDVIGDADLYILSVNENSIAECCENLKHITGMIVHTSGTTALDVFKPFFKNYGVFYPLQSFKKDRNIDLVEVPVFYEANNKKNTDLLETFCKNNFTKSYFLTSEKRKYLHLSAIFANNFVNASYMLAEKILNKQGMPYSYLLPLIEETAKRQKENLPKYWQTGPAVRNNKEIINKHLGMLSDSKDIQNIYKNLSDYILKEFNNERL